MHTFAISLGFFLGWLMGNIAQGAALAIGGFLALSAIGVL